MNQKQFDRINELARKAKTVGLSEEEKAEQKALREEYIKAYRESLRSQLDNMVLVDPDGTERTLKRKGK
ncbi:MAG: DUF896 domain-containing protein [Massiliimalia sp.]|jgi:uncharacterized protein YnzC (UPF0291/DUF896 family)